MNENENLEVEETEQEQEEEIKEVKFSKRVVSFVLCGFALLLLLIGLGIKGRTIASIQRRAVGSSKTEVSASKSTSKNTKKTGKKNTKIVDKEVVSSEVEVGSSEKVNSTEEKELNTEQHNLKAQTVDTEIHDEVETTTENKSTVNNSKSSVQQSNQQQPSNQVTEPLEEQPIQGTIGESSDGLSEVVEPVFSKVIKTSGIVSDKNVYMMGNSYVYEIKILMVISDGVNETCSYFCPKKTYDALKTSDTVSVSYQVDNAGNISVSTISK